jgi:L-asparaginase
MPAYTVDQYEPLLDSSSMTPAEWVAIARDVASNYARYDGL